MMRKLIQKNIKRIAILLFASTPGVVLGNTPFDAFYTGIGVGESITKAKLNSQTIVTDSITGFTTPVATSYNLSLKKDSWLGAIYGGYGFSFSPFYLGGELFLKFSDNNAASNNNLVFEGSVPAGADITTGTLSDNTQLTFRKVEFSLDVRPGILLSACSLLYGRIGIAFNRSTLNSNISSTTFNARRFTFPINQSSVVSQSKNIGFRVGLGLEEMFCNCVGVRVDYIFTRYRRITINTTSNGSVFFPAIPDTVNTFFADQRKIKPINHSFMLGLTYYW